MSVMVASLQACGTTCQAKQSGLTKSSAGRLRRSPSTRLATDCQDSDCCAGNAQAGFKSALFEHLKYAA
eukprot:1572010-Alexandrium_andersonii.AAC.1